MNIRPPFEAVRADQMPHDARNQMAHIFADGFSQWLDYFSNDKKVIANAFAHMFKMDQFYVAVSGQEIAAMAACTDCHTLSLQLDRKQLRKFLGLYKGVLAGIILKRAFEKPFEDPPSNTGSIEFVGTALKFRSQGAASHLIDTIMKMTPFEQYIIEEVADTNLPAMKLYRKLGFEEYKRKQLSTSAAKKSGIQYMISLRRMNNKQTT
ncbi:GNAT family N-acetyltransferase [Shouchella clausii]|uniref:GNAT family N-acetyltransferase n=1 Tax=Shouchella clausii TaxID=79880 RepID=UPI000B95EFDD|nr:GNAT family N-acetyltransferase [Shouchella clausii]MCM3313961.1 GNAT family N-acetyltransferase [Psychrobacillus sp. MER TA 17]AST98340.1 GNAT family N-acetyltransferase [Shouchella clausii]MBX0321339.1 GNAT family N-acetyltransferase [Shouchella clausii]MCR1288884.1 GNAT family N-acetyltransferase [Shouchella clausii]MCY1105536.1 GNAT family N-acetyltransferase [Shouchella clausii]